jgi:tellurite resistance protein
MASAGELLAKFLPDETLDEALLDVIALSACADGVARSELDALTRMARELPSCRSLSTEELDARVRAAFDRLEKEGLEERLRQLGELPMDAEVRRRMFTAAAIVQYADGHVTNEENEFLLDLADTLRLDEVKVREIVDEIEADLGVT